MLVRLKAYAKINLYLEALSKRADGYHELRGIMRRISLHDDVTVTEAPDVRVTCDAPLPANNTAFRAARACMERFGCGGAEMRIKKRIPSEAGLGGASADAAAVLWGMSRLYGLKASKLNELAPEIGADVPFCMLGGCFEDSPADVTAIAEGVGERLTPLAPTEMSILVVKGEGGVSTRELFCGLRLDEPHDFAPMLAAANGGDAAQIARELYNGLEPCAAQMQPKIVELKQRLLDAGALGASMSGSGAAVFGIFADDAAARRAAERFDDVFCALV